MVQEHDVKKQDRAAATVRTLLPSDGQRSDARPRKQPPYHVVLLDDNHHTYEYVIEMLVRLFGHSKETALRMATEVDTTGRVIVDTTTLERAELKRDQIHAFGPDPYIAACQGSMSAAIEPSQG